jgi:hypothetical protein
VSEAQCWGHFRLLDGQLGRWRIGSLSLWIGRRPHEWRIHSVSDDDPTSASVEVECPTAIEEPLTGARVHRIALRAPDERVQIAPALADRPVVAHPHTPLSVLAGDEVTVYVSTPLWVQIRSGEPSRVLFETPAFRPSDTWFGPSTTEGEICYASRTSATLTFENVEVHPARVITAVNLENNSKERLFLERISLPVPYLSLFADKQGAFWTQSVTIEREEDGTTAQVRLGEDPPKEASAPKLISGPRLEMNRNVLVRALGALLG